MYGGVGTPILECNIRGKPYEENNKKNSLEFSLQYIIQLETYQLDPIFFVFSIYL